MWLYENNVVNELPEDCVGFVYQITNTTNGRMYIGKKLAKFKRSRKPLKGRKNKRRYKIDSDWQDYYGSSDELTIDIKKLGKENFKREILFYCNSKAVMSYVEAREQFARKVLESNDYYNGHIRVRVHGKGILKEKASD
jgi:c-di-GMP-related signal transduction protein